MEFLINTINLSKTHNYECNMTPMIFILGFHMTSPQFKVRNYCFSWVSTFMWYYSTLKPLHKQILGSKGFFVFRYMILEFPGFCVTQHLADSQESSYVGHKYYRFWEILLSKHSLAQNKYYFNLYEFLKQRIHSLVGKLKNRCFCWFPAAIFVPLKGTQTWHLQTKLYYFGQKGLNISHIKYCQTRFLARLFVCIYLLSFPRF